VRPPPLACSVRDCARPLERRDRAFVCSAGHSFDLARSGYVNLLQPQDRRSRMAGDAPEAIGARAALLSAGVGRTLVEAVAERVSTLDLGEDPVVVDLGCGSGDALAAIAGRLAISGLGVDLSTAAVEHAARRFSLLTWVVANADRRLPVLDRSVDLVMSLHGRRNPAEAARVLSASRHLLVAVPGADDLIELRELVQGQRVERDRGDTVVAEHKAAFDLVERAIVRETPELERESLLDLLRGTYRGVRRGAADRVAALARMRVTLSSEIFLFRTKV
jgi:23S rRNA (guanine745-N1)-methyltransferase